MKYNPEIHRRRSVRLRGYDYSREGAYFITICVENRYHLFGEIGNQEMLLNAYGEIAYLTWEKLPSRWPHIQMGAFQIMPNHMHGIIVIHDSPSGMDTKRGPVSTKVQWAIKPTVGQIVGAYKSCVLTECLKVAKTQVPEIYLGKIWQRGFWDHVIRDVNSMDCISQYIIHNPKNWKDDRFFDAECP